MSNHTGTVRACQYHAHSPRPESTPPPSSPASDTIDRRLVQRYGVLLLTGGYTALPTYAWVYYARLGVSEAEMVCLAQLCTYWWSARDPYPGEAALAVRMGKTVRTIQGYLRSLEAKGLLHIHTQLSTNGRQSTNAYDLRPFFAAVEGLARLDGLLPADDAAPATPAMSDNNCGRQPCRADDTDSCNDGPSDHNNRAQQRTAERKSLCADATIFGTENRPTDTGTPTTGDGEGSRAGGVKDSSPQVNPIEIETFDYDSIPPTPAKTTQTPTDTEARLPASTDPDDQALAAMIADLSAALGDDAPRSSLGRARNLCRDAGVSPARFLRLLDEAAARTRDRQVNIVKRQRDGQASNGMPYLFAVLTDLLHPAPPRHADDGLAADRRRAGPSGRRRSRREGSRREPINSYVAWSDSPARLPIVEEHPVWRAALDELAQVMTSENFNAWLATTRALDQVGEVLRVAVPAAFNKTWLEHKLHGKVAGALHKIDDTALHTGRVLRVEYVVEPAACGGPNANVRAS